MAEEKRPAATGKERRNFYRATTRLRVRILPGALADRPWLYLEPGAGPFLHRPGEEALERARTLLEAVPRRTVNLSEGGMRIRLPDQEEDRKALGDGLAVRPRELFVLLEFPEERGRAIFGLPARLVRLDDLPWAVFPAMAFRDLPDALRRRLAGFVLSVSRQRRRHLLLGGKPEEAGMAKRLARLEAADSAARHAEILERPRPRRNRFFP